MSGVQRALAAFFAAFCAAYPEGLVPEEAARPYLVFSAAVPVWGEARPLVARVVCDGPSLAPLIALCERVASAVPANGRVLMLPEGGALWLLRKSPFWQVTAGGEEALPDLRSAELHFTLKSFVKEE